MFIDFTSKEGLKLYSVVFVE